MDRRFLTVIGVSLVFALVVSSIFYQMTSRAGAPKTQEITDLKDVVIAARPLSIGLTVKATDLKVVKMPASHFPKGAFSKPEDVIDRPVVSNVLAEEPLLEGRLAQRGSGVGLAPVIPVGMRAVTVRVNDVVGVAGFVLPGMRVDILITGAPPGSGPNRMTKTVLQNIMVLSAGQTIQTDAAGKPVNAPNVTLLVSPPQAELLTLAGNEGHIQLVLRNGADQGIESTKGQNLAMLYGVKIKPEAGGGYGYEGGDAPPQPRPKPRPVATVALPPPPPPAPVAVPDQIITIRATDKRVETVAAQKRTSEDIGRNQ
jgi:pilus assembly protein CpaB